MVGTWGVLIWSYAHLQLREAVGVRKEAFLSSSPIKRVTWAKGGQGDTTAHWGSWPCHPFGVSLDNAPFAEPHFPSVKGGKIESQDGSCEDRDLSGGLIYKQLQVTEDLSENRLA
jgi:hypothetical protein